jgi:hypothetical protein
MDSLLSLDWAQYLFIGSAVLGALVVIATAIAPLTDNKVDDQALKVLIWIKALVDRLKVTK